MRGGVAAWVLIMFLANALVVSGIGGANNAISGAHERAASRAVTLIYDVYDLQNMSKDLNGSYELANDIDASDTVNWNDKAGFAPVGNETYPFNGTLDGKDYNITGLFIDRLTAENVGLFGYLDTGGLVKNVGIVENEVTGNKSVGGLVGYNLGTISNSYAAGNVALILQSENIGGLAGYNAGTISNSSATGNVSGSNYNSIPGARWRYMGGLVGYNTGTVSNSSSEANVTGTRNGTRVGGLVGYNTGTVNNSYATGNVEGDDSVGGLVGSEEYGEVLNSYATGNVNGSSDSIAGLVGNNYQSTVNNSHATGNVTGSYFYTAGLVGYNYLGTVNNSYATGNVNSTGLEAGGLVGDNEGLVNSSYATGDVIGDVSVGGLVGSDGSVVCNSYATGNVTGNAKVGGLAGYNSPGAGDATVTNSYATGNVNGTSEVGGLVGNNDGTVNNTYAVGNVNGTSRVGGLVGINNGTMNNSYAVGNVNGTSRVGGLVGDNPAGKVNNSYATGNVTGTCDVGGLAGYNENIVNDSYATGNVTGDHDVGGLVGCHYSGTVNNSHYNIDQVSINGGTHITIGGLFEAQYKDWFSSGLSLNISDYSTNLVPSGEYYGISDPQGLRDLLGFAGVAGYKFRLTADIDLSTAPGLYIPYLVAEFDGDNHTISNLYINLSFAPFIGMFGLNYGGMINNTGLVGNDVSGFSNVGGLVGYNTGSVNTSYATGNVTGTNYTGGLVGHNSGTVNNTYAAGNVTANGNNKNYIGGLVGHNSGKVNTSYATGKVTGIGVGIHNVGGLVGCNNGTVSYCFWDNETSGRTSSAGGTGKTTAEMKTRSTFTNAGWDFDNVWFMIENETYPIFQWQDILFPIADAGIDQTVDEGTVVTFNGRGSSDHFGIANYTWTFRDGDPRTIYGVGPMYKFDNPGIFNVKLNVTNVFGNWNIDTMTVTVIDITPPESNAGPDQIVDEGTLVTFNGSSSSDNVGIVNYAWTFTDGCPASLCGAHPTYLFDNPGIFVVTLNVTDAAGNWGTDTMTVTVKDITAPVADAGADRTVDPGNLIAFDGNHSTDNIGIVNYTWTFTDGAPITLYGAQPTYRFDKPGIFIVTLNVTDAAGNWDNDTMTVTVNDITAPVADAGPDQMVDEGTLLTFNGCGSSDDVGIVNYSWTFTDTVPVTLFGVQPKYLFDNPGIFVVTLKVADATGNRGTDTMTITVNDITAPVADAGPDQTVDEGTLVTFNGSASTDNVGIVYYSWEFIDGAPMTLYGVRNTYQFENPGLFAVTLFVKDAAGNWDTYTITITVNDITAPVADAGPEQTVDQGMVATFNGNGSSDNVGVVNFTWTFTDGGPVMLYGASQTYKFDNPGIFLVKLKAADAAGNWGIDTLNVTVLNVSILPICTITFPMNGSTISGTINITGLAIAGTLPLERVEVRIDGGDWKQATGHESWKLVLDTHSLNNGQHTIEARAFGGQLYSDNALVTTTVNNTPSHVIPPSHQTITIGQFPWMLLLIIIIAIGVVVLYFRSR